MSEWNATTVEDVLEHLHIGLFQAEESLFREGDGFARSAAFLALLGDPQERVPVVHIAGTAGKGSVAYAVAGALTANGVRTGLHVSPHVYDLRERWQVDGRFCTDAELISLFQEVLGAAVALASTEHGPPTFYEYTLGMALLHFAHHGCECVVLETGLGGTFDGTNTVKRPDKVAVVTRIGLDHERVLGETVEEIAAQKAGIFQERGRAVALQPQEPSVERVLLDAAASVSCDLELVPATSDEGTGTPLHLRENEALARRAFALIAVVLDLPAPRQVWPLVPPPMPGRFEVVRTAQGPPVVLDGAHNAIKSRALCDRLRAAYPNEPIRAVFGTRRDKKLEQMLSELEPHLSSLGLVQFDIPAGDVPADVSVSTNEMRKALKGIGSRIVAFDLDTDDQIARFITSSPGPVLVSGSFALLARVRPLLARPS